MVSGAIPAFPNLLKYSLDFKLGFLVLCYFLHTFKNAGDQTIFSPKIQKK